MCEVVFGNGTSRYVCTRDVIGNVILACDVRLFCGKSHGMYSNVKHASFTYMYCYSLNIVRIAIDNVNVCTFIHVSVLHRSRASILLSYITCTFSIL